VQPAKCSLLSPTVTACLSGVLGNPILSDPHLYTFFSVQWLLSSSPSVLLPLSIVHFLHVHGRVVFNSAILDRKNNSLTWIWTKNKSWILISSPPVPLHCHPMTGLCFVLFCFGKHWSLNSEPHACGQALLLLEPLSQPYDSCYITSPGICPTHSRAVALLVNHFIVHNV
jgi:hypothetical protein